MDFALNFIDIMANNNIQVTVYTTNGIRLYGVIDYVDANCMVLTRHGVSQIVFLHAVATVLPGAPTDEPDEDVQEMVSQLIQEYLADEEDCDE